jgi:hypothetical protein
VEFNKYDIPYLQGEIMTDTNRDVFEAVQNYQFELAMAIEKRRSEMKRQSQQRLDDKASQ